MVQNLQLLIKPASSACNEHCSYCFYSDEALNRNIADSGLMQSDTAEALIRKAFEYAGSSCDFIFQGGEPLLAGLDFFRSFVKTADRLNAEIKKDAPLLLSWSIQTNGTMIDNETASFLKEYKFLVGVSLDGPRNIHDRQRGAGSFDRVMAGIRCLKMQAVDFNILCVVTEESCGYAAEIYNFFKGQGFNIQQYIPCLNPLAAGTSRAGFAPLPESWGVFLCRLFDLWEEDIKQGKNISVRYFENIARVLLGMAPESCGMSGKCSLQFTVESDGSVYPCDFYALDNYRLGNINSSDFEYMAKSKIAADFTAAGKLSAKCDECHYYMLCHGGCKRERDIDNPYCTRLCRGYLIFFKHATDRLWALLS